jgi:hypothetical protein
MHAGRGHAALVVHVVIFWPHDLQLASVWGQALKHAVSPHAQVATHAIQVAHGPTNDPAR